MDQKIKKLIINNYDKRINDILDAFLKEHDCILYGGMAIDKFIPIYDECQKTLRDYDFYSSNALRDVITLANILFTKLGKYIVVNQGLNRQSYSLIVDGRSIADIKYIPQAIYKHIPYEIYDGIKYATIDHLLIDIHVAFTFIVNGIFRWKKDYERMMKMIKYNDAKYNDVKYSSDVGDVAKILVKKFIDKNMIIIGGLHFNLISNKHVRLDHIDIMVDQPLDYVQKAKEILGDINIHHYDQFYEYLPERWTIYKNGSVCLNILKSFNRCFAYNIINGFKVATIDLSIIIYKNWYYNYLILGLKTGWIDNLINAFYNVRRGRETIEPYSCFNIKNIKCLEKYKCENVEIFKSKLKRMISKNIGKHYEFVYIPSKRADYLLDPMKVRELKKYPLGHRL